MPDLLAIARGDQPAELVLRRARLVNVYSGLVEPCDIAVAGGVIVGIGSDYKGDREIDLDGAYVAPGLIDAHVHIESSLCTPPAFASAVVPRGVTTVITDPHEIANVCGVAGIRFMIDSAKGLPLDVIFMAPSCVPATDMATGGATLGADDLIPLLNDQSVRGLAEVMNFPGVIHDDRAVAAKLRAFAGRPIDGHCPGVRGRALNAYVIAGIGSDHESVTLDEAAEKLSRGMYVLIREATNARNLEALLPLINSTNSRRICFCTDDRQPDDLLGPGGIDYMLRTAISGGIAPVEAFRLCTLNSAEWFGLHDRGAIAPGKRADLMIFDDLNSPQAKMVFAGGRLVAEGGKPVVDFSPSQKVERDSVVDTCHLDPSKVDLRIPVDGERIRVIGSRPNQLVTDHLIADASIVNGYAIADIERDLLKMAVIDRHTGQSRTGLGFIHGIGLRRGAIAGTVAHDHHNLVVIGCDDASMMTAVRAICDVRGGLVVTELSRLLGAMSLPVAGLMTDQPIEEARRQYDLLLAAAKQLGSTLHDPFMAMSFMALEVIPDLKLTDQGLVDVTAFRKVGLFVRPS